MLKIKLDSRRMNTRRRLSGLLPGKMLVQRTARHMSGRVVDVSHDGMGVLSSTHLLIGDTITLTTPTKMIILKVNDKKKDYAKSSRYRYSLVLDREGEYDQGDMDLEEVFVNSGCMS